MAIPPNMWTVNIEPIQRLTIKFFYMPIFTIYVHIES